ncbi:MAG: CoA transferase [Candidatus Dormibacteraeota bacterium]|nr:CoA transferase [Candidatus Dormibacteraeota bacterium]
MLALDDVRILDLSRLLPGPFCTLLLADLGADVIKIEDTASGDYLRWMPPLVGEYSAMFHAINRNKRSVALDLKSRGGRDAFLTLVESADVVLESFRPGVMERLGIGYDALRTCNRRVVLCSISGYGQDGPYRDRAGHDLNYAALAGVLSIAGHSDGVPAMPPLQVGDLGAGALHAAVAILAALHQRERSGEGQHCDIAMLDGLISWLAPHAAVHFASGEVPGPATLMLNGRHPCYRMYRCADGAVSVGALEPKFWRALMHALDLDHLADSAFADGEEAERVAAEVQAALSSRTTRETSELLGDADVCCEPVLTIKETFEHPQVQHRRMRLDADDAGPIAQTGFPVRLSASSSSVRRGAPGWGADTRDVLADAGYSAHDIDALASAGAIR